MTGKRARASLLAIAVSALGIASAPPPAAATFHLVLVREVFPGSSLMPGAEYVQLQAYAPGQNLVAGHSISILDANGKKVGEATFASDAAGGANQATFLAATPAAEAAFGVAADGALTEGSIDPSGGAACWESLDCVAWGGFHGAAPSPTGSPADPAGIPDGLALRRTIAPGCATLLEASDDRDASAIDFADAFPAPRPNSAAPGEHPCGSREPGGAPGAGPSAGGGGGRSSGRPRTRFRHHPPRRTRDRTPTFRFASDVRRARFLCKVDRRRFRRCRSPFRTRRLRPGRHVFRVKARAPDGATDRSPATWRFRVLPRHLRGRNAHARRRWAKEGTGS